MYIIIYMYIHACVPFSEIIMCEVVDHNLTSSDVGRSTGCIQQRTIKLKALYWRLLSVTITIHIEGTGLPIVKK